MTFPIRPALLSMVVLAQMCSCTGRVPASSAPDPLITKVETGLSGRVHVVGEPIDAWSLSDRMAFYKVPGVSIAVLKDGKIIWAKGYGVLEGGKETPVDADTIFQAASISKPVAAITALRLVEQGKLSLDAPINDYLKSWKIPQNEFTERQAVTLRQIMSHTAGFTVSGFPGYATDQPVPTLVQILDGVPPANTPAIRVDKLPGESWRYSGGGYTVLQLAIADVSGQLFADLARELVLAPAGMTRSAFSQPLPPAEFGNAAAAHRGDGTVVPGRSHTYPELAAAGLWTTPSDLLRLALAVVAAANHVPGAILDAALTEQMLTVQADNYGLGFDLNNVADGRVFWHGGSNVGFQSVLFAYTDGHGGAAIMTSGPGGNELNYEIQASIAAAYGWKYGAAEERNALTLTPERAAEFAGIYVAHPPPETRQPEMTITITAEGDTLWAEMRAGAPKLRLYVASETEAFFKVSPILKVTADATGRPTSIEFAPGLVAVRKTD
jgi:CubicO group peptidase (beta-lactamase class C family)